MQETSNVADPRLARWILRLRQGKPVRVRLPTGGRIAIDRALPFLAVHRPAPGRTNVGTGRILASAASFAQAPVDLAGGAFPATIRELAAAGTELFGAFLLLEVWTDEKLGETESTPAFRVHSGRSRRSVSLAQEVASRLEKLSIDRRRAEVSLDSRGGWSPLAGPRLFEPSELPDGVQHLGLSVRPIYRDPRSGELYPAVLRAMRRRLGRALQRAFYSFSCSRTNACPIGSHMLGRRAMVKAVWEVDRRLGELSDRFDFLLQVTPTNSREAWEQFQADGHEVEPVFRYRPLPLDPVVLKRELYAPHVERVEDSTLEDLFRRKQAELDRQITMLDERGTRRFVLEGAQLYGEVDPSLLELAHRLVDRCPIGSGQVDSTGGSVEDEELARRAGAEMDEYRERWSGFAAQVQIRDDIAPGMMVSRGNLLIGRGTKVAPERVDALLQHEVGTHSLTYFNATAQPLRILASGLDDYEALQEGIAVLAEYLAGGLGPARLRLLGARVVAVDAMLHGATFVDTFRLLSREHCFAERAAFMIAMRIHRGGGLTKDAIYLKGLVDALEYIGSGARLEPLFVGKIAPLHIPMIRELQARGVLVPAPLMPHYLTRPEAAERLARLVAGMTVLDLLEQAAASAS